MWQRWNGTTHVYEKSDDSGATWVLLPLNASIISEGSIADARLSANVALRNVPNTFASWNSAPTFRGTQNGTAPTSGAGAELTFVGATGSGYGAIFAYDRTGNTWQAMHMSGSSLEFDIASTPALTIDGGLNAAFKGSLLVTTNASVFGTLAVTGAMSGASSFTAPYIKATSSGPAVPGPGIELLYDPSVFARLISYDRTAGAFKPLRVEGSTVGLYDATQVPVLLVDGSGRVKIGANTFDTGLVLYVQGPMGVTTGADPSPYTQQRISLYNDGGNWGYLAYGTDANMRIVYSNSANAANLLLIGRSVGYNNTGAFFEDIRVSAGVMSVTGRLNVSGPAFVTGNIRGTNGGYYYPGSITGESFQASWFIGTHSSYGIYMNTGLYIESALWCTSIASRAYIQFTVTFPYQSSPQGSMFVDPQFGTTIRACTGSVADFSVINAANNAHLMYGITGTQNMQFPGTIAVNGTGDIAGGILSRQGAGGTVGLQWTLSWTGGGFNTYVGSVFTGTIQMQSDARLKTNVQTIPSALDALKRLRPITFEWAPTLLHAEPGIHHGLIGQEVETVLPDVVRRLAGPIDGMPDHARRVDYIGLIPLLIRAVQELSTEIADVRRGNH